MFEPLPDYNTLYATVDSDVLTGGSIVNDPADINSMTEIDFTIMFMRNNTDEMNQYRINMYRTSSKTDPLSFLQDWYLPDETIAYDDTRVNWARLVKIYYNFAGSSFHFYWYRPGVGAPPPPPPPPPGP